MSYIKAHYINAINNETGNQIDFKIAEVIPAKPEHVKEMIDLSSYDDDGRSNWVWLRLQNGDLLLGFFPQGSSYFDATEYANEPCSVMSVEEIEASRKAASKTATEKLFCSCSDLQPCYDSLDRLDCSCKKCH